MLFNNNPQSGIITKLSFERHPKSIVQFYRASPEFVLREGGKSFWEQFLDSIDLTGGKYVSIDSRVSMLMPDWYPCIPGWHCDDFYRINGHPALENLLPIKHYCTTIGAEVSTTEFVAKGIELPSPIELWESFDTDRPLYAYYNELIELNKPPTRKLESGEVMLFHGLDFHRGLPATQQGWRAFIRATVSDHREPKDEIRTQSQVYLTAPFEGW